MKGKDMNYPELPTPEYHWVFPHHSIRCDSETFLRVLEIFEEYEGGVVKGDERDRLNVRLAEVLSQDKRSDSQKSDPFRDYQQVYTHLGVLYPTAIVEDKIELTPLAKLLTSERMNLSEFLLLQAFGYQYPNGASGASKIKEQIQSGVRVKPILLIFQVLSELNQAELADRYISEDEIVTFLVPQVDHLHVREVADQILDYRAKSKVATFGARDVLPIPLKSSGESDASFSERRRTVAEIVRLAGQLPFFKLQDQETSKHIILETTPIDQEGLPEVEALSQMEALPETFWQFRDASEEARLAWFNYFGGVERRTRWYRAVGQLSREMSSPPGLSFRALSVDGQDRPIAIAPAQAQRTAEQTAKLQQDRLQAHEHMVNLLAQRIQRAGGVTEYDPRSVDLRASLANQVIFFEIKTLAGDQSDVVAQTREATGQLLEYRYRAEDKPDTLCIVFDVFPESESWIIEFLGSLGILTCWWDETIDEFRASDRAREALKGIL